MRAPWWLSWKRQAVDADVIALVTVMCVSSRRGRPPSVCFSVTQIRGNKHAAKENIKFVLWLLRLSFLKPINAPVRSQGRPDIFFFVAEKTGIVILFIFYTVLQFGEAAIHREFLW